MCKWILGLRPRSPERLPLDHVFSPITIGNVTLKNRIYMTPHTLNYAESIPGEPSLLLPSERHVKYYAERARGEVALIIVEGLVVHPSGDCPPFLTSTGYDPRCVPPLRKIANIIHDNGSKAFIEPWHTGSHATTERNFERPISASPIPPVEKFVTPKEMDDEEIGTIQESFVKSIEFVKQAGFDGVDLHATHGYLLNQFLSPFYNRRNDRYGGSIENRLRFLIEILQNIRSSTGKELAVGIRLIADEMIAGGLGNEQMAEIARRIEETRLLDFIDVDIGNFHTWPLNSAPMYIQPGHEIDYVSGIKEVVRTIPILGCAGRLTDLRLANEYIAAGKVDMVGGARGFIAEPELVKKSREGRFEDIITCIACNQFCISRNIAGLPVLCVLNPVTGREAEWSEGTIHKVDAPKRVVVIGGGPAGMEAARVLGSRGHIVTLFEKEKSLGGQLKYAHQLPGRDVIKSTISWYEIQLRKTGVKVILEREVDEGIIRGEGPDAIVVATGSYYTHSGVSGFIPERIPGSDQSNVLTPEQCLASGSPEIGKNVLILDDESFVSAVGIAEMLADKGRNVEIVTRWQYVGVILLNTSQLHLIYPKLYAKGVRMTANHYIREIRGTRVTIFNIFTNDESSREADTVVMITSKLQNDSLGRRLKKSADLGSKVYLIGDCASPRGIGEAIYEGHKIGRQI